MERFAGEEHRRERIWRRSLFILFCPAWYSLKNLKESRWRCAQHFDLSFLGKENPKGLLIYCCGPERLMSAVETACAYFPIDTLRVERFAPKRFDELASMNQAIEVVMKRSGITLIVPPNRTILKVVNEAGARILSACRNLRYLQSRGTRRWVGTSGFRSNCKRKSIKHVYDNLCITMQRKTPCAWYLNFYLCCWCFIQKPIL